MTRLPSLVDYSDAVANPRAFTDPTLAQAQIAKNAFAQPKVASGGFALTFDATTATGRYAVRCFHKHSDHLADRYAAISAFIRANHLPFLADVDYQKQGVRVGSGVYPVVKMQWVEGTRLDDWLDENVTNPEALRRVRRSLTEAVTALQDLGAAHGDLQHGNILVRRDGSVTLVDYDGMYLPQLKALGASEYGHPNYQHPKRMNRYDTSLDVFPAILIDMSLRALEHEPALRDRFDLGENILLSARDFKAATASPAFAALTAIPQLRVDAELLAAVCGQDYPAAITRLSHGRTQAAPASQLQQVEVLGAAVVAATDAATLRHRVGDQVTVIGKITHVYTGKDRFDREYSFLNCGQRTFTVVCWPSIRPKLNDRIPIEDLKNRWIRLTGTLELYKGNPQIQLRTAQQLHMETPERAALLLRSATRLAPPAVSTTQKTPAASTSSPPSAPKRTSLAADFEAYSQGPQKQTPHNTAPTIREQRPPSPPNWPPLRPAAAQYPPPPPVPANPNSHDRAASGHRARNWILVLILVIAVVVLIVFLNR